MPGQMALEPLFQVNLGRVRGATAPGLGFIGKRDRKMRQQSSSDELTSWKKKKGVRGKDGCEGTQGSEGPQEAKERK